MAGVRRFLHMSALGARPSAVSNYHRSKWAAEEAVAKKSGLDATIFRPSVVFGRGRHGPNFVDQLADLVRSAPLIPILGDGHFLLQPVSVRTVAAAFAKALQTSTTVGMAYELGGPTW